MRRRQRREVLVSEGERGGEGASSIECGEGSWEVWEVVREDVRMGEGEGEGGREQMFLCGKGAGEFIGLGLLGARKNCGR